MDVGASLSKQTSKLQHTRISSPPRTSCQFSSSRSRVSEGSVSKPKEDGVIAVRAMSMTNLNV